MKMTQAIKRMVTVLVASMAVTALYFALTPIVRAQEVPSDVTIEEVPEESQAETEMPAEDVNVDEAVEAESTPSEFYSFVAQSGDSYTKIARKAVQIYGFDNTVELSGAQIVFIETNLTQLAGSPALEINEAVSVNKTTIGEWVEKAKTLTDAQKAAWQYYADRVDFNTDNVGEARQ